MKNNLKITLALFTFVAFQSCQTGSLVGSEEASPKNQVSETKEQAVDNDSVDVELSNAIVEEMDSIDSDSSMDTDFTTDLEPPVVESKEKTISPCKDGTIYSTLIEGGVLQQDITFDDSSIEEPNNIENPDGTRLSLSLQGQSSILLGDIIMNVTSFSVESKEGIDYLKVETIMGELDYHLCDIEFRSVDRINDVLIYSMKESSFNFQED